MPGDDLLRFLGGPLPLSAWWPAIAVLLVILVAAWCAGVWVWTLPPERLRTIPLLRSVHTTLLRRRFLHSIHDTTQRFHERALTPAQASAAYDRAVRSFLSVHTGVRAQYLHLDDLAQTGAAKAAPLLAAFDDAQFNNQTRSDVTALGRSAEELVRTWI
ncbi:hypothetical protein [Mycobacterium sp. 236(2023)]|uniref:hypothetical protein n=1 Tax=Mycobacterium sp. 236(2023) TaxID=3038163 RepID=UPI0024154C44|nr:hypothetical protein [Mycobacterium sp. 236(2023)]MDG4669366.1 hypothetical protein [Mycobacterium sp. 236(2023)]